MSSLNVLRTMRLNRVTRHVLSVQIIYSLQIRQRERESAPIEKRESADRVQYTSLT